jgi:tight adherence protein B
VLPIGIFFAITVGSLALLRALANVSRPDRGRIRRRLAGEFSEPANAAAVPLYKDVDSWDADDPQFDADESGELRAAMPPKAGRWDGVDDYLREAGVAGNPRKLFAAIAVLALALGVAGFAFVGWLAGLAGTVGGVAVPLALLAARRKARRERYVQQLAGAFELMARVLRAGQSVPESFRAATEAFGDPLAGEFTRCLHQIEHGLRPEAAYRELSRRSGILELRIFVVAMMIQRQTGSNLSDVLERMAAVVRERMRMRQKLRSLTAEGRLQSLTLIVLPVVTFAAMYFLNRHYAELLLAQWRLLLATVGCMGVGVVWIRNIMQFEG